MTKECCFPSVWWRRGSSREMGKVIVSKGKPLKGSHLTWKLSLNMPVPTPKIICQISMCFLFNLINEWSLKKRKTSDSPARFVFSLIFTTFFLYSGLLFHERCRCAIAIKHGTTLCFSKSCIQGKGNNLEFYLAYISCAEEFNCSSLVSALWFSLVSSPFIFINFSIWNIFRDETKKTKALHFILIALLSV